MNALLIKHVRPIDAQSEWEGDVLIKDGIIAALGWGLPFPGVPVVDGEGRTLLPAFLDLHAHFRDPGFPEKEDIRTGSWAAVHGGFTAVSVMANTVPACDSPEVARYIRAKAEQVGLVDVFPVGAVTRGQGGEELADFAALAPYVWAFSDDGKAVEKVGVMEQALRCAALLGKPLLVHLGLSGVDQALGEELMVSRDLLLLAKVPGARLHLQHLSTAEALPHLRRAKSAGLAVTAEVTPHHLALPREDYGDYPVNPPLVSKDVSDALVRALRNGVVDAISTDHAPHTSADKERGLPGISGIETAFPLLYTRLVKSGRLSLSELSRRLSLEPARIMGLRQGLISIGYAGDVVLVELDEEVKVDAGFFLSKSHNTPILGERLWGRIWATVRRGEVVFLDGKVKGRDFHDYRQVVRTG